MSPRRVRACRRTCVRRVEDAHGPGAVEGPHRVRVRNATWTCRLEGNGGQRITAGPGAKLRPAFGPGGSLLAFSADLDGNLDAYVVPAAGGVPKRLTWHPGRDVVQGFTPDGKSVLFTSPRAAVNNRHTRLFTVPVDGGLETELPIPYANRAAYSPDGKTLAYNPNVPAHLQWKRYRGGEVSRVWLVDTATWALQKLDQPASRCNDVDPMWLGEALYLRSDRDGEFNLYAFDPKAKALTRLTAYTDFPVLNAAAARGRIVSEQAGPLHLSSPRPKDDRPRAPRPRRPPRRHARAGRRARSGSAARRSPLPARGRRSTSAARS